MVDDIQFISKKTSTQEEFFNTFNELYQASKQIIITSDRPPKEIETLTDRLRSRFTSGLIQDIQQPDLETRIAILRKKCQIERYSVDDDAIDYIAEKVNSNIRDLEGMLAKVYFLATLAGKPSATKEEAVEAIDDQFEEEKNEGLTADDIIEAVCKYFNISRQDIVGKKKNKEVVEPRMIAIYLINEILEIPLISIGKIFGGRDHTTIMHSRDKIADQLKSSYKIQSFIGEIKKILSSKI
jgi:chromosomal replication initiator protein